MSPRGRGRILGSKNTFSNVEPNRPHENARVHLFYLRSGQWTCVDCGCVRSEDPEHGVVFFVKGKLKLDPPMCPKTKKAVNHE